VLVKEIMTTDVKTISVASTIQDAARLMADMGIGSLVVTEKKMLVGIITEGDILRDVVAKDKLPSKTSVKQVMAREVVAIGPDATIEDAAEAMTEKKVKRLPVVYKKNLVGIVSAVDIVAAEPKMMEQIAKLVLMPVKKKLSAAG
jgi:CBS domain-containing protein